MLALLATQLLKHSEEPVIKVTSICLLKKLSYPMTELFLANISTILNLQEQSGTRNHLRTMVSLSCNSLMLLELTMKEKKFKSKEKILYHMTNFS